MTAISPGGHWEPVTWQAFEAGKIAFLSVHSSISSAAAVGSAGAAKDVNVIVGAACGKLSWWQLSDKKQVSFVKHLSRPRSKAIIQTTLWHHKWPVYFFLFF